MASFNRVMAHTRQEPDDLPTDRELMQRMASGDNAAGAFDALFARHRRAVFGFALRMLDGDTSLAEDATQEAFLSVWRTRAGFTPGGAAVRTYLLTVARNRCLDERKRRRVSTAPLYDDDASTGPIAPSPGVAARLASLGEPEHALLARELSRVMEAALTMLPPDLREVALLRDTEGLSYEEISRITDCPLGTVKSRISAARARLRAAILVYLESDISSK